MATKIWVGTDSGNEGDYGTAANWSPSGVPIAADDVWLVDSTQDISGTLDQSAVALASFTIAKSYTGLIGTETTFLEIDPGVLKINTTPDAGTTGSGSQRINLDLGSNAQEVTIFDGNTSATDSNRTAIRLICNNSSNNVYVRGGQISFADDPADTATIGTLSIANPLADVTPPNVALSSGVTATTLTASGGTLAVGTGATTLNVNGGTVTTKGSGAITTVNMREGVLYSDSSGTITTLNVYGGTASFTRSSEARTVTNLNLYAGTVTLDKDVVTLTNDVVVSDAGLTTLRAS